MHVLGVPLWTVVLVACIAAPFVIRLWIEAEQQRTKRRTAELLRQVAGRREGDAAGPVPAASTSQERAPTSMPARESRS